MILTCWIKIFNTIILILESFLLLMKKLSDKKVDDILKLKFGKLVTEPGSTAYVSNQTLA